ncbi:hypothetical protein HC028_22385 [Planosporangium flavigriseum]|uniref:SRPBCC family protein n=1 Tax=Planosporangium flavigriseum TaxID=373681 RepID=UPI00143C76B9|nr:SRPBCC family protein [Planosporangium flavigriseum]NJC67227.1 hypothetical protein [Planosporangium flavigriseum]
MSTELGRRATVGVVAGATAGVVGYLAARAAVRAAGGGARRTGAVGAGGDGHRTYRRAVTIYRAPAEVYAFCRDQPNLAESIGNVVRVDEIDDRRSCWVVAGPGRSEVEFPVEIVNDDPQVLLDWRVTDAPVPHEGSVSFTQAPGGRGTEVRLVVTIHPGTAGLSGPLLAADRAERLVYDALRRVKQVLEAGEVVRVEGQSSGRDAVPREVITQYLATGVVAWAVTGGTTVTGGPR